MRLSDFHFDLPEELIAKYPMAERSASRLLCLDGPTGGLAHRGFRDLLGLVEPGDLLVFNNTRVIPARLFGHKPTGGAVEVLVERVVAEREALCYCRASKAPKAGSEILLEDGTRLTVLGRAEELFQIGFPEPAIGVLERLGHMPLPPYIDRPDEGADQERYQTVYAEHPGAVAAPTAGLHFDEPLLEALRAKGVNMAFVTLHVGAGTFSPVRVEDIREHKMHSEALQVGQDVVDAVKATHAAGRRVIAVGTTSVRCLETAARASGVLEGGELQPYTGDTDIFIYPGYRFALVDALVTNFHLPESTLIMLVSAFAGREAVLNAYREAVAQRYRFFSYGDAMFITRREHAHEI